MSLQIELLGAPRVIVDREESAPPRGRKAWALLAYLLLSSQPQPRERLATLLFDEAADPLGALRWNLAQLRRALGGGVEVSGDPLTIRMPEDSVIDAKVLTHGDWTRAIEVAGLGRDLLEGIDLPANATFETWLLAERRRLAGVSASILREAAIARLAAGEAMPAVDLASRLVAIEDFDEEAHALLIRAYVASGDVDRARQQFATSSGYLRDELGVEPSATLGRALGDDLAELQADTRPVPSERGIEALIEAGRAVFNAGGIDAGIQTLQRATDEARAMSSIQLQARAQLAHGTALVHTGRGRDGEGATILHAALSSARTAGDASIASEASRELGYVEFLRGRYDRAQTWLDRALASAPGEIERISALAILGATECDRGRTGAALDALEEAAEVGARVQKPRIQAWAHAHLGRTHLLRGELDEATFELDSAIEICRAVGWMSYVPLAQTLRGDVHLLRGEVDLASDDYEASFALGCQIGDPCWEGLGARGIGLVHIARGHIDEGFEWLDDAATRCVRTTDAYVWIEAYVLDAQCASGLEHGRSEVGGWARRLETLAARTDMREMLVRSQMYRADLGSVDAAAARLFARDIDNPLLLKELAKTTLPA